LIYNFTSIAKADDLAFSRNARTFETQQSTLTMKGVGHACLTMVLIPDGLPCNPALTPFTEKPKLGVEILLSYGYSGISKVRKGLKGTVDGELVNPLFGEGRILQIEASVELNFLSK